MILTASEIAIYRNMRSIKIDPWDDACLQPASYDVHMGEEVMFVEGGKWVTVPTDYCTFKANKLYLGTTMEHIALPKTIAAMLTGKSSLARMGVMNNVTAGYIDPGYVGRPTLELIWFDDWYQPQAGDEIGQLIFMETKSPSEYHGHYQGNTKPTVSTLDTREMYE